MTNRASHPIGPDPVQQGRHGFGRDPCAGPGAELIRRGPGADSTLVLDRARRSATHHLDGWITVQPRDLGEARCEVGPMDVPLVGIAAAPVNCQGAEVGADDQWAGFLAGTELRRSSRLRSGCARDDLVILTKTAAMPDARAAHITGAAFGAAQHARWEFVANPRWTVDAALFPDHDGKVAVATLRDALRGQEIARNMCNETIFVTADSLGSSYDISDCPDQ